ncbi:MAG: hypothetical protein Q9157_003328 [Trypethelium eluteriae]
MFEPLIIRHPHYDEFNTLLKLPALGKEDTIDYNTALIICGIICDNSYNSGWLARSRDGTRACDPKVPLGAGEVYYFATSDKSYRYPICPSWDEWLLPSIDSALPSAFASFAIPPPPPSLGNGGYMDDLKLRDASCRMTDTYDCCEQAHLVPASARDWWEKNMANISGFEIESAQNGMLLRTDLHRLLDSGAWVPMVKEDKMVLHVLRNTSVSNQFIEQYHDREMQPLIGINMRCLFARIAYSVLPMLSEFLSARRLARENTLFKIDGEVKEWTPEACKSFKIKPRSRNPSPTKPPRLEQVEENGLVVSASWHDDHEDEDYDHINSMAIDGACDDDDSPRGRKRQRSSSRYCNSLPKRVRGLTASKDRHQLHKPLVEYPSPVSS